MNRKNISESSPSQPLIESDEEPDQYVALNSDLPSSSQTFNDNTQSQDTSTIWNPLAARLYQKFIRFLIGRRLAQGLVIATLSILILCELQYIDGQPYATAGEYDIISDVLGWLQAVAWLIGTWYCWIPFRSQKDVPDSIVRSLDTDQTIQTGGFIRPTNDKSEYESPYQ